MTIVLLYISINICDSICVNVIYITYHCFDMQSIKCITSHVRALFFLFTYITKSSTVATTHVSQSHYSWAIHPVLLHPTVSVLSKRAPFMPQCLGYSSLACYSTTCVHPTLSLNPHIIYSSKLRCLATHLPLIIQWLLCPHRLTFSSPVLCISPPPGQVSTCLSRPWALVQLFLCCPHRLTFSIPVCLSFHHLGTHPTLSVMSTQAHPTLSVLSTHAHPTLSVLSTQAYFLHPCLFIFPSPGHSSNLVYAVHTASSNPVYAVHTGLLSPALSVYLPFT
jgi:hypothetical protein